MLRQFADPILGSDLKLSPSKSPGQSEMRFSGWSVLASARTSGSSTRRWTPVLRCQQSVSSGLGIGLLTEKSILIKATWTKSWKPTNILTFWDVAVSMCIVNCPVFLSHGSSHVKWPVRKIIHKSSNGGYGGWSLWYFDWAPTSQNTAMGHFQCGSCGLAYWLYHVVSHLWKLLYFEWSPPWHHIIAVPFLSQILTFFVLKSGEGEEDRITLMKSRALRSLDFIRTDSPYCI